MDNPRAEKVAVVDEVRERLASADGALLTEYRGLTVAELARLRRELSAAGGDYKIYKNTLVRLAIADGPQAAIHQLLTGPTAIAFVQGDVSAVAKALRDFAKGSPNLVVKGGIVGEGLLSASEITVLADLPPRETLLAQFAGALSAPLQQLASLLEALPRNLAYGLSALLDQRRAEGGAEAPVGAAEPAPAEDAPAPVEAAAEATDKAGPSGSASSEAAPAAETPAPVTPAAETPAPVDEASAGAAAEEPAAAEAAAETDEAPAE